MQLVDIDVTEATFTVWIEIILEWHDHRVYFTYLKNQTSQNAIPLLENEKIEVWIPNLVLKLTVPGSIQYIYKKLMIRRDREPVMTNDNDVLRSSEKYVGRHNPFKLTHSLQAKFVCDFNKIKDYPFGIQRCSIIFGLDSVAKLVNFRFNETNLTFNDTFDNELEQFTVIHWSVESRERNYAIVLHMKRSIISILMVTYLPTVLMNIINQAVVYIQVDNKYELIITVNITCMMVLSSVYLSVSSSLPSTPSIKPVEWWLLFNLIYPFLVIITNVISQV